MPELPIKGSDQEIRTFTEVNSHYRMARQDLEQRIFRKNGFDDADKMFASFLDEGSWPYRSLMFDPRPYTVIIEKSARLIGNKPRGRLVPREGGDTLGAYINNELLSFQWDDNARLGDSMISKWILMDQTARKYGSAFAVVKWRYEKKHGKSFYDGPDFTVCNSRDVLANPSYSYINKWFQHREYVTLDELRQINDQASTEPVYKNLDLLEQAIKDENKQDKYISGDRRESNILAKNKQIRGLTDFLGDDMVYKVLEIVTEYRCDRWVTFAPRHGVILRDIPNPYNHYEIPVVHLKYYPLMDDLYGVSELEPVAKQIRGINAHLSAYSDRLALKLRPPVHVNPTAVRMHTLEWNPEAKWLMNNPNQDVQIMRMDNGDDNSFAAIYNVLVGSFLNAVGENSQGFSQANPIEDQGQVTATEIRDTAFTRNVRDNMNLIFLSEAIKKQTMLWLSMNKQFLFKGQKEQQRVIRIVGKDAMSFFMRQGLADYHPTDEDAMMMAQGQLNPEDVMPGPRYAVGLGENEDGEPIEAPKLIPDETGQGGNLILEPGDLEGEYDYIPDIESMKAPSTQETEQKLTALLGMVSNPAILQQLAQEGYKPKIKDILERAIEATNVVKDADAFFEELKGGVLNGQQGQAIGGGVESPMGGPTPQGAEAGGGMGQGATPPPGGNYQNGAGRSPQVQLG